MSEPSGWIREPYDGIGVVERLHQQDQLVRRGGHVGVGEDDELAGRVEHPGPDGRPLAAVRAPARSSQLTAGELRPGADQGGGRRPSEPSSTTRTVTSGGSSAGTRPSVAALLASAVQVAEQLVQRGTQPGLLVVRGQDDGEGLARASAAVYGPTKRRVSEKGALGAPALRGDGHGLGETPTAARCGLHDRTHLEPSGALVGVHRVGALGLAHGLRHPPQRRRRPFVPLGKRVPRC